MDISQRMGSGSRLSVHLAFASAAVPLVIANPWGLDTHALPKALAMAVLALAALGVVCATGTWRVIPRAALVWAALLLGASVLSLAFSQDWRGSLLGAYQHRHGFVTHVGLLALLLASACAPNSEQQVTRQFLGVGVIAAAVVSLGLVEGIVGGPERVALAFGNRNDIGAVIAVSLVATAMGSRTVRHGGWLLFAVSIIALAASIAVESRGALLASLMTVLILVHHRRQDICAATRRHPFTTTTVVVTAVLAATAWPATHATLDRLARSFERGSGPEPTSNELRLDIWRGGLAVFWGHPIVGAGQDSLLSEFDRHRPASARLDAAEVSGGELLVASPHNAALEVLYTLGIVGALAVGGAACYGITRLRAVGSVPSAQIACLGAGALGLGMVASVSPVPVAALSAGAYMLGAMLGLAWRVRGGVTLVEPSIPGRRWPVVAVTCSALTLLLATSVLVADTAAARAVEADRSGNTRKGLGWIEVAVALAPYERTFRREEVRLLVQESTEGEPGDLKRALNACEKLVDDFPGLARDHLQLATLRATARTRGVESALLDAERASPASMYVASAALAIRVARQSQETSTR